MAGGVREPRAGRQPPVPAEHPAHRTPSSGTGVRRAAGAGTGLSFPEGGPWPCFAFSALYSYQPLISCPHGSVCAKGPSGTLRPPHRPCPRCPGQGGAGRGPGIAVGLCPPMGAAGGLASTARTWDSRPQPHSPRRALDRVRARLSSVSRLICEGHNCGINTPRPAPAPGRRGAQVVLVQVRLRQSDKERVGREAGTGLAPGAAREGQGLQGGELRLLGTLCPAPHGPPPADRRAPPLPAPRPLPWGTLRTLACEAVEREPPGATAHHTKPSACVTRRTPRTGLTRCPMVRKRRPPPSQGRQRASGQRGQ